jgi:membrane protein implicated in regulation of membrane protease activity
MNLLVIIFRYLVGLFLIIQGTRGLKTGLDFVGGEMAPWVFKGGILIGFLIVILGSAFPAYGISAILLRNYFGVILSSCLAFIVSAFIMGVTAFYILRYWRNYDSIKSENEEDTE